MTGVPDEIDPGWIQPAWPAPAGVRALTTTRTGGVSTGVHASLNLGDHCGDAPDAVRENRGRLMAQAHLPAAPGWLRQVHGREVVDSPAGEPASADAAFTHRRGCVLAVLTADCVPVLLCDTNGQWVAAVHAGWRGLVAGVLDAAVDHAPGSLLAWIGPCIRAPAYEVDAAVRDPVLAYAPEAADCLVATRAGHWQLDLAGVVARRLTALGAAVTDCGLCTHQDNRFYSHRRDRGRTGRQASVVWLQPFSSGDS